LISFLCAWVLLSARGILPCVSEGSRNICELKTKHLSHGVESRKGAGPGPNGNRWFPFPAHQTGRAHFEHPAFRQTSPHAHGSRRRWTSRSRSTPNFPYTTASEKHDVPRDATLWRCRRKYSTRS